MKLIWWGDICERQHAGELLDMMDQIHEYAVTTHRPFVASHLEAWERFIRIYRDLRHWRRPDLHPLPNSEQESELSWYSIKSNSTDVQKLLRDKRRRGILLTDDDVKRATLEARLKEWEGNRSSLTGNDIRRRGKPRKVRTVRIRQQPLRRSKKNLQNPVHSS